MQRTLVTGNAGSGKTTLAADLAARTDLPYAGLDNLVWQAGWARTPKLERLEKERVIAQGESWIVDGVSAVILDAAETVIFLDYPRSTCFWRAFRRNLPYLFRSRPGLPERCPEILIFPTLMKIIWRFPKHVRPKILAACKTQRKRLFHIHNDEELEQCISELSLQHLAEKDVLSMRVECTPQQEVSSSPTQETESTMKKKGPSKEVTALLEPFPGLTLEQVVVPATLEEFTAAAAEIKAAGVAGFDTESKPTFNVGDISKGPHVVQFAIAGKAFIFQVHREEVHPFLIELLQSEDVLKVGFGLKSDHSQIRAKFGTGLNAVLDLDTAFRKDGYSGDMGVRAAIGLVLNQNFRKSKSITTTNWSLRELSPAQLLYAANDAYAALKVWEGLKLTRPELL